MGWRRSALTVLTERDARQKCELALAACGPSEDPGDEQSLAPPLRPGRPAEPLLVPPRDTPKRGLGSLGGRIALLHALAHIELNAVDLAFDMALRFAGEAAAAGLDPVAFIATWVSVGEEEARHFLMLDDRLRALGSRYGALPAHDGLWEAAEATADSLLARLAIAPMVLEARGLDVTPGMAERLKDAGDPDSARILEAIYAEEIGHVAKGVAWFEALCRARASEPRETFARLVAERFRGRLKPPFNDAGRVAAGLEPGYYALA
jgi:uncharacterized ferritin-like protein (DUF455 family)